MSNVSGGIFAGSNVVGARRRRRGASAGRAGVTAVAGGVAAPLDRVAERQWKRSKRPAIARLAGGDQHARRPAPRLRRAPRSRRRAPAPPPRCVFGKAPPSSCSRCAVTSMRCSGRPPPPTLAAARQRDPVDRIERAGTAGRDQARRRRRLIDASRTQHHAHAGLALAAARAQRHHVAQADADVAAAQRQRRLDAGRQRRAGRLAQRRGQVERGADQVGTQLQQGRRGLAGLRTSGSRCPPSTPSGHRGAASATPGPGHGRSAHRRQGWHRARPRTHCRARARGRRRRAATGDRAGLRGARAGPRHGSRCANTRRGR